MKINSKNWKDLVRDFPELNQILKEEKVNWAKNPVNLKIKKADCNDLLMNCQPPIGAPNIYVRYADIDNHLVADMLEDEKYFILSQTFSEREITIYKVSANTLAEAKEKLAQERASYQNYLKICFNREAEKVLAEFLKMPDLYNLAEVLVFWSKEELWFDSSLDDDEEDWAITQAYRRYAWVDDMI